MPTERATTRRRLDREAWAEVALEALSRGGLSAVAVEPIARQLGATKGSFYHHFTNRDDLVRAALDLWEGRHTLQGIDELDAATEPRERLRQLIRQAISKAETDSVDLLASADHPLVAPVLQRVTAARLEYLARLYRQTGRAPATARRLALLTYSAHLGHLQIAHSTRAILPRTPAARQAYVDLVLSCLDPADGPPQA
jgi:AcrR family transcriptional regulator